MIKGILILVFMLLMISLIISRKWPILAAIPVLTLGIAVIAGVPLMAPAGETSIIITIISEGSSKLVLTFSAVLIAAWMSCIMQDTGISETMIRKAAELGGDKTNLVAVILFVVVAALSTTMSGLGAVIMMGTIVIPVLISVGVDKLTAASILLMAYGAGEHFGMLRATFFGNSLNLDPATVYPMSLVVGSTTAAASLIYIGLRLRKNGKKYLFSVKAGEVDDILEDKPEIKGIKGGFAMMTPLVPIVLAVAFKWPVMPSFLAGIVWALIFTYKGWKKMNNLMAKTCYDGFLMGAPSVILMIFLGMLLNAINTPQVQEALTPIAASIMPHSVVVFVIMFIVIAPLCLYRGPLNSMGLGAGIATLMASVGVLPPIIVCVGFLGVAGIQETSCPTNTYNIWVADFVEEDVLTITKKQLFWVWAGAACAIIIGTLMYWK